MVALLPHNQGNGPESLDLHSGPLLSRPMVAAAALLASEMPSSHSFGSITRSQLNNSFSPFLAHRIPACLHLVASLSSYKLAVFLLR